MMSRAAAAAEAAVLDWTAARLVGGCRLSPSAWSVAVGIGCCRCFADDGRCNGAAAAAAVLDWTAAAFHTKRKVDVVVGKRD